MFDFAVTALASILFVVDPIGAIPAYLVMTDGDDRLKKRSIARRASLYATLTLGAFAVGGRAFLRALGLTMPAFQVAGGLILFLVALDMLRAQRPTQEGPGEVREGKAKDDPTITPLTIPRLAGPAALSTVATLMSQAQHPAEAVIVYAAIGLAGLASYLTLRAADPLYRALGRTGIHVLSRIFGLILAAIAVQFVLDGLKATGMFPVLSPPP